MDGAIEETRNRSRYCVRGTLSGFFGAVEMLVCDLSETGLQLEHAMPLKVGTRARGAIQYQNRPFAFRGVVTRSKLSANANRDGKLLYRSGVRLEDPDQALIALIHRLIADGVLFEDRQSLERKRAKLAARAAPSARPAMRVLPTVDVLPSDQLLLVRQARERLRAHPDEARKWYNRARFVDPVYANLLARSPFRDEILAVWEYLERTIDIPIVARAFDSGDAPSPGRR